MPVRALAMALVILSCGKEEVPDTEARVSSTQPPGRAASVAVNTVVSATFARAMDPTTITEHSFLLTGPDGAVAGSVSATDSSATLTPASALGAQTGYTASLTTAVKDALGEPLPAAFTWSFTTGNPPDRTSPTVVSRAPSPNATLVPFNTTASATFSKPLNPATVTTTTFTLRAGSAAPLSAAVSANGVTATLSPNSLLLASTTYTAQLTSAVQDTAGNPIDRETTWSFTTGPTPDTTPPGIVSTLPAAGASGVALNGLVFVVFSEPMSGPSISTTTVKLKKGTSTVAGAVTLAGNVATFRPDAALVASSAYTATVTTGVKDVAGNALAASQDLAFTTGAAVDTTAPSVLQLNPTDGTLGVGTNVPVTVVFSEPLDPTSVNSSTVTLTQGGQQVATRLVVAGNTLQLSPTSALAASTACVAGLTTGIKDTAGNALAAARSWTFTTGGGPDTVAPGLTSLTPADGERHASVHTAIVAAFNEPLSVSSASAISLTDADGHAVAGTASVAGPLLGFQPAAPLAYGARYTGSISTALEDAAGNGLAAPINFAFDTQPVPAVRINEIAPKVASGALGDTNGDEITSSSADEFVELLNNESVPVDLGGWVIRTGGATLSVQFTFPAGTTLAAGGRAVVFGGGTPSGSFGSALVFVTSGLSLTDGGTTVELDALSSAIADTLTYAAAPGSGASWVRNPEGSGPLADHTTVAGAGILWSPGVAAAAAIPKVNRPWSDPAAGSSTLAFDLPVVVQFNLAMDPSSFTSANLKLFASSCASLANEVAISGGPGTSASQARLTPTASLQPATLYCVQIGAGVASAAGAPMAAALAYEFSTAPVSFDLVSAVANSATHLTLTFSAAPGATPASEPALYCVALAGAGSTCSSALAVTGATPSGNTVLLDVAAQAPGTSYDVFVDPAVVRASDGAALTTAKATFPGFTSAPFLLDNPSFEADSDSAASAAAAPAGWTMITTNSTGNRLHALVSGGAVPAAHAGANVARFDSLTSSTGGREAHSVCLPVTASAALTARGWLRVPQNPAGTHAAFKLFWFTDAACTVAATHAVDTQNGFSLAAQDAWLQNTYALTAPTGATYAYLGIRANFISGTGASTDAVYFDDLSVTQP